MKRPECGEEIGYLVNVVSGTVVYHLSLDGGGNPDYDALQNFISDDGIDEYQCSECDAVLFTNEPDAVEFLKSG